MPLLICFLLLIAPVKVLASEIHCPNSGITIEAEKASTLEFVCESIDMATVFIESVGLRLSGDLRITLHDELPKNGTDHSIGYYNSQRDEIRLLDYDATVRVSRLSPPAFGVAMNPTIWRSFLIHELSHAAAQNKFKAGVPKCTASEYIASVVQIASMPSTDRENIFQNYPELTGFDRLEEITMAFYMLDPGRFSLNAYLHFSKPGNGVQFINRLLSEGLSDN